MTEKLLQFIWQFQYFNRADLQTIHGEKIEIIFPGNPNTNQGPDFFDARIRIRDTLLAGSVELHLRTSDWKRHGHDGDVHYNNVILHVVFHHDQLFARDIPILELAGRISRVMLQQYALLMDREMFIPCGNAMVQIPALTLQSWKERLLAERLTRKSKAVMEKLQAVSHHWEELFWRLMARNFGMKVNGDAFEAIAETLPLTLISRHKSQIHHLEALLLGQAGLLEKDLDDNYFQLLRREYRFLKTKYGLKQPVVRVQFHRLRPVNFPTIRLAQLAALVLQSERLFSKFLEAQTAQQAVLCLQVQANDYWHYHYQFGQPSSFQPKKLGQAMTDNIMINTVAPMVFAYGWHHQNENYKQKAIQWLDETAAEENNITAGFVKMGLELKAAFDSQALIELKNEYCNYRRCLSCAVGNVLMKKEMYH